jgi:hypothetical protein
MEKKGEGRPGGPSLPSLSFLGPPFHATEKLQLDTEFDPFRTEFEFCFPTFFICGSLCRFVANPPRHSCEARRRVKPSQGQSNQKGDFHPMKPFPAFLRYLRFLLWISDPLAGMDGPADSPCQFSQKVKATNAN